MMELVVPSEKLAARASLQCPYDQQVMTPCQLFEWAVDNIPAVTFQYMTEDNYKSEQVLLEQHFEQSHTIHGTQKLHCFFPLSSHRVSTKVYSSSSISKEERVTIEEGDFVLDKRICDLHMMMIGGLHVSYK